MSAMQLPDFAAAGPGNPRRAQPPRQRPQRWRPPGRPAGARWRAGSDSPYGSGPPGSPRRL